MGWSRPIQHNLNINNPWLSFELSTLAYFRYLIKVFTLLVSVFALDTNKLSIVSLHVSPGTGNTRPMVTDVTDVAPVSEATLVIVTVSSCLKRKSLHKCFCIFCKGQAQDYNLRAKTFNSVNIFMVSKRSCKFFIASQSQAFSKFSPALINTIRVFLSRRGLTGLMSPGPVWTTLMLLRRESPSLGW